MNTTALVLSPPPASYSSAVWARSVSLSPRWSRTIPHSSSPISRIEINSRSRRISCKVATSSPVSASASSKGEEEEELLDELTGAKKIGARVRVTAPLKVYHVPKVPEVDLTGMEGEIKQFVGLWKGKRISANLPFKVQFVADIPGRGPVKFVAHLKEDEFEILD